MRMIEMTKGEGQLASLGMVWTGEKGDDGYSGRRMLKKLLPAENRKAKGWFKDVVRADMQTGV